MAERYMMKQYNEAKREFSDRHGEFKEKSEVFGRAIRKTYFYEDGAQWNECTEPITVNITDTVFEITLDADVELYRTEIWDTDNSISRYLYEVA